MEDISVATFKAMEVGHPGEVYHIGKGLSSKFNDIIKIMSSVLGRELDTSYMPNPYKSYQRFTQSDNKKTETELEWTYSIDLRTRIEKMVYYFNLL